MKLFTIAIMVVLDFLAIYKTIVAFTTEGYLVGEELIIRTVVYGMIVLVINILVFGLNAPCKKE